ncbi:hypothetical protein L484_020591 [Morus notabilis]|uniref:Uncharacterized protein n=1 Tax=Morus notabilis TaxID=981085 RepID=W9S942_9ROSA|nr:hypothetical protein L484_020591 [Morus notabilis]
MGAKSNHETTAAKWNSRYSTINRKAALRCCRKRCSAILKTEDPLQREKHLLQWVGLFARVLLGF